MKDLILYLKNREQELKEELFFHTSNTLACISSDKDIAYNQCIEHIKHIAKELNTVKYFIEQLENNN